MKYSKVLNRPMFNKHNSAYGRGIASNLVSDEERQRFNYGGRVGFQEAGGVGFAESPFMKTSRSIGEPLYNYLYRPLHNVIAAPLNIAASGFGYKDPIPYAEEIDITEEGEQFYPFSRGSKKITGVVKPGQKEDVPKKKKGVWEERLTAKAEIDDPTGVEMETETLDVADWTPQEKKEKRGQLQLAMAERLIGGSRDKWGSTAQMKNLAGALGDVRKITDKEDIRKDQRKYRAYAEAQKDIAKSLEKGKGYASFQAEGMRPGDALYRSAGIDSVTIPRSKKDKDITKAYKNTRVGDVIFDENDTQWKIKTPDGFVTVTVDEIVEAHRKGTIAEMKELAMTQDSVNVEEKGR